MSTDLSEYHRLLELSPTADTTRIKAAFRRTARSVHPDLNPDDPDAAEKFTRVRKAFAVLTALAEYREARRGGRPEESPKKEVEWRMTGLEREGPDLVYHLALDRNPGSGGGRLVVPHRVENLCPDCRGRGRLRGRGLAFLFPEERICPKCAGQGLIRRVGEVRVDLLPSLAGDCSLRFRDRGPLDPGSGRYGDLVLNISPSGSGASRARVEENGA